MTNAEAILEGLKDFDCQEAFIQETVAYYINCPSSYDCDYDDADGYSCVKCKVKWLLSEWEG